jgi:hypothetical protein
MHRIHAPLLIHIGLHKTASTWLQDHVLDNESFGFCAPWGRMSDAAVERFVTVDPLQFDVEETRRYFQEGIDRVTRAGLVPVLTHEALSSQPLLGQYYAPQVGHWLKAVFPRARVLIVFREQKALIGSLYRQYVRNGGSRSLEQFIGSGDEPPGWAPLCRLGFFEFDRLVEFYRGLFGPARVLALPIELLRRNRAEFVARILSFAGTNPAAGTQTQLDAEPANVGWSAATLEIYRRLNRIVPRNPLGPNPPTSRSIALRIFYRLDRWIPSFVQDRVARRHMDMIARRVASRFAGSNSRLGELLGQDLASFGYPTLPRQPVEPAEEAA